MLLRLLVLVAVTACSLAWARDAKAEPCGPAWTTGPVVDSRAGVILESLDARMECSGPRGRTSCRLRETYVVRGGSTAGTPAAIWFDARLRPEVHIDGLRPVHAEPPRLEGRDAEDLATRMQDDGEVMSFLIPTSPGMARRIVIESRIRHDRTCHRAIPIERRHPLVSRNMATDIGISSEGTIGLERSPDYTETKRLRLPSHWALDKSNGWRRDGDARRGEWTPSAWSRFSIEHRPPVTWGGPFAAVGVAGRTGSAELKLRAGWEAGILRRVLVNVAVESDAKRHLEIVPAIEMTFARAPSRDMWWLPLPSAGVGAPVQIVPDTRGGIRGLVGLHWPYVAIVGFVDGYPPVGSRRRIVTGGAMLQVGI